MAKDAIVFVCGNPTPEVWPWEAKEAGARIVATGRGDFPNQVNNSLVFPGLFRGTLDSMAKTITDEMAMAAAMELARFAEEKGLREDAIVPTMADWQVVPRVAAAVALAAQQQGLARVNRSQEEYRDMATRRIMDSQNMLRALMHEGVIRDVTEPVI
jgi:malate dehydrogenase (oxaloacetate-decarboxylating)